MICVFTGPTIRPEHARPLLDAVYLPPVSQGDVYRVTGDRPWAIAIIDGYFEHVPAVWHKEILWAMAEGIHVFGAASMGALRAAELETFGMVGVGKIFEAYRDGRLEDDDEVAVVHGSAEDGFRPGSEAMVSIRATLESAVAQCVIDAEERRMLEGVAKSLYYPLRNYPAIVEQAKEAGWPSERRASFADWLGRGRIDQKRADAMDLLRMLAERFDEKPEAKRVEYAFQRTEIWEHAVRQTGRQGARSGETSVPVELLLDELRLLGGETYRLRRGDALLRALALQAAKHQDVVVSNVALQHAVDAFRRRHDLRAGEQLSTWVEEQGLDEVAFRELIADEARVETIRKTFSRDADASLEDALRACGLFADLSARVREKGERVGSAADLESAGIGEHDLLSWYFEKRLGRSVPADLESYAAQLDLPGSDVLLQMLLREYLFELHMTEQ